MSDDDFNPYEWHVGDPADWGDGIAGTPDIPYMGYLNNDEDEEDERPPENPYSDNTNRDERLVRNLTNLAKQHMTVQKYSDGITIINKALSICRDRENRIDCEYYGDALFVKAEIYENILNYTMAMLYYDKSSRIGLTGKGYENCQRLLDKTDKETLIDDIHHFTGDSSITQQELYDLVYDTSFAIQNLNPKPEDLPVALEMAKLGYRNSAGDCERFRELEEKINYKIHYLKNYDKVLEEIENGNRMNYITITGTSFYNPPQFRMGMRLRLVREPENVHDPDAIAVYLDDRIVGYVANSVGTSSSLTAKASEINIGDEAYSEYLIYHDQIFHIAKLI